MIDNTQPEEIYSIEEVSNILHVSKPTVYNLIKTGKLKAMNVGVGKIRNRWRVTASEIVKYSASGGGIVSGRLS